jgi:hypothetical protein
MKHAANSAKKNNCLPITPFWWNKKHLKFSWGSTMQDNIKLVHYVLNKYDKADLTCWIQKADT